MEQKAWKPNGFQRPQSKPILVGQSMSYVDAYAKLYRLVPNKTGRYQLYGRDFAPNGQYGVERITFEQVRIAQRSTE